MVREYFDGRRVLVHFLICVNLVIWGTAIARADEKPKESTATEYVEDTITSSDKSIRLWRFDPKAEGKRPAVLFLYGVDGLEVARDAYCTAAKQLAGEGYVVFLVHYLDSTPTKDADSKPLSEIVQRGLRGTATAEESRQMREHFRVWMACGRDAAAHARKQPHVDRERLGIVGASLGGFIGLACAAQDEIEVSAVVSCFGGLPREMHAGVKKLPPTLVLHGDKDELVPVEEARALEKLAVERKLTVEVKIYDNVGHLFQKSAGKFDTRALLDGQQRMTAHLRKHLNRQKEVASGK
jgi:carboxymethylenebutenolidase